MLAISIYIISQFRKRKYLLVGWLWFLGTLVPVIGFVQVGAQAMADRYTYVPLIGLFIIVAWGISDLFAKLKYRRHNHHSQPSVILFTSVICSRFQVQYWQDSITLFEHALKVTEKNYTAHSCLAYVLCEQGKIDEAIEHNRLAIEFNPTYLDAQFNLGGIFLQQGNLPEALKQFYIVLQIKPDYIKAQRNIAKILIRQNKPAETIPHYESILKTQPLDYDAHNGIGIALARIGKLDEAFDISIVPFKSTRISLRRITISDLLLFDKANSMRPHLTLTKAIQLDPNNAKTHYQFARVLSEKSDFNKAVAHLKEALRLDPNYIEPMNNLAWFLASYKAS